MDDPFADRRRRAVVAADRWAPAARPASTRSKRRWPRAAPSSRPSRCAASTRTPAGSVLDVVRRLGHPGAAEHRGLRDGRRGAAHRPARPRGARDQLGEARGHRRRAHAAARPDRAARRRGAAASTTASSSCPTPTTTRCSPPGWRRPAARRSCRSARRSDPGWGSATRTTSR